jgi:hypothetical protein
MDDTTRQARERREQAQDFFAANPRAWSVGIGGTVYRNGGTQNMKYIDRFTREHLWPASATPGNTPEQARAIGYCLSLADAGEPVEYAEYRLAMSAVYELGITSAPLGWRWGI